MSVSLTEVELSNIEVTSNNVRAAMIENTIIVIDISITVNPSSLPAGTLRGPGTPGMGAALPRPDTCFRALVLSVRLIITPSRDRVGARRPARCDELGRRRAGPCRRDPDVEGRGDLVLTRRQPGPGGAERVTGAVAVYLGRGGSGRVVDKRVNRYDHRRARRRPDRQVDPRIGRVDRGPARRVPRIALGHVSGPHGVTARKRIQEHLRDRDALGGIAERILPGRANSWVRDRDRQVGCRVHTGIGSTTEGERGCRGRRGSR